MINLDYHIKKLYNKPIKYLGELSNHKIWLTGGIKCYGKALRGPAITAYSVIDGGFCTYYISKIIRGLYAPHIHKLAFKEFFNPNGGLKSRCPCPCKC